MVRIDKYRYLMFFNHRLKTKNKIAVAVQANVTNWEGNVWLKAYKIIMKAILRNTFLNASVFKVRRSFFQFKILAVANAVMAKVKLIRSVLSDVVR